jgi:hypothetical protein
MDVHNGAVKGLQTSVRSGSHHFDLKKQDPDPDPVRIKKHFVQSLRHYKGLIITGIGTRLFGSWHQK